MEKVEVGPVDRISPKWSDLGKVATRSFQSVSLTFLGIFFLISWNLLYTVVMLPKINENSPNFKKLLI